MAQLTNIEWTEMVWNFLRGCRRVSEGCGSARGGGCYAERQAIRHAGPGGSYEGLVKSTPNGPRWTGELSFHDDILLAPLKRKTPTKYFVNSMSDLFYEKVTDEMLTLAFDVMARTPWHTYQILTKRAERAKEYMNNGSLARRIGGNTFFMPSVGDMKPWPLPNVWLGVSVEDQKTADERIPLLLATPAVVRWISAEPLLGPIDLTVTPPASGSVAVNGATLQDISGCLPKWQTYPMRAKLSSGLDWIVVGGESGPGSRPCDVSWIRSIIEQCRAAEVPVFVKQLGSRCMTYDNGDFPTGARLHVGKTMEALKWAQFNSTKGGDMTEWPEDMRIREMPEVAHAN